MKILLYRFNFQDIKRSKRLGFEFKYQDAPRLTSSMSIAFQDLGLKSLTVIVLGKGRVRKLASNINVVVLEDY